MVGLDPGFKHSQGESQPFAQARSVTPQHTTAPAQAHHSTGKRHLRVGGGPTREGEVGAPVGPAVPSSRG